MPGNDGEIGIGELSRQVRDVLARFEGLAARLESQFVRSDNFQLYKQLVDQAIMQLQGSSKDLSEALKQLPNSTEVGNLKARVDGKAGKSEVDALESRVAELEDDKKWLSRLVLGFIVLGVIGAAFALQKAGAGG